MVFSCVVCIGRFQPFHWGHWAMVQAALNQGERVIILLGSHQSRQYRQNPWTAAEREQMIRASLSHGENECIDCLPIPDFPSFADWSAHIHQQVTAKPTEQVAILSYHPEGIAFFREYFPHWTYIEQPRQPHLHATDIRHAYFQGAPEPVYRAKIPAGTLAFLREFKGRSRYWELVQIYALG
ncbi:MAG: adenylyltransferase/cytidyltransferase family protein [Leptolyngbyaceae cyanobacterium]